MNARTFHEAKLSLYPDVLLSSSLCLLQVPWVVSLEMQLVLNYSFCFVDQRRASMFTGAAQLTSESHFITSSLYRTKQEAKLLNVFTLSPSCVVVL